MQPDRLSDEQLDDLAAELAPRLPTGTHGDRVILPRRTFAAAIGGTLGVGALTTLGVDRATAQAAGRQGTPDDPNDMFAWDLNVANQVTSDLPMGGHDVTGVGSLSAEQATVDGDDVLKDTGESSANPGFDTWTQIDAERPALVAVSVSVATDGTSPGRAFLRVDVDGDGVGDRQFRITRQAPTADGARSDSTATAYVPPGGQYQIDNDDDPTGSNGIIDVSESVL